MLFSSILFIFYFLPILLLVYYAIPKRFIGARNGVLLAGSLIFYSWGEPVYVFLMIYSAFMNYFMAIMIGKDRKNGRSGRKSLVFTVILNLFILCFFKYYGFLMDTVNGIFGTEFKYTALALPIGISFYTFQALSYIIDVYKGNVKIQKSFLRFSLYLSLFPQLIAGPIVKYKDIEEQLGERETTWDGFGEGAGRFIFGLGKKVLLANNLGALHTAILALSSDQASVVTYWIGIFAYTMQIYFDFSGYSDMAIGLGRMFGFRFLENFNYPYISKSITEFWRRWHISLSTWFREYLYIPMGGNRVAVPRHIFNLLVVWFLTGLWHGASWNFVVWGLLYCFVLILEKYVLNKALSGIPSWAKHVYTMLIVMIAWVFFSSADLASAVTYLKGMFFAGGVSFFNMETLYLLRTNIIMLLFCGIASTHIPIEQYERLRNKAGILAAVLLLAILGLSVAYLIYGSYNPFLYFRF